jgi:hypothetical protein
VLDDAAVEVAETAPPPTVHAKVVVRRSPSSSAAVAAQVSVSAAVGLLGDRDRDSVGARLSRVMLALPEALLPRASVAVTSQVMTSVDAAAVALRSRVLPAPSAVPVVVLVQAQVVVGVLPSESLTVAAHVSVSSLSAGSGVMVTPLTTGGALTVRSMVRTVNSPSVSVTVTEMAWSPADSALVRKLTAPVESAPAELMVPSRSLTQSMSRSVGWSSLSDTVAEKRTSSPSSTTSPSEGAVRVRFGGVPTE